MKKFFSIFLLLGITSISYAYEQGKIDTHGGKGDPLTNNKMFSNKLGIFADDQKKQIKNKDKKNFIEINKIKKIETKGDKK